MQTAKLREALHSHGLKLTKPRLAVIEVLAATAEHLKVAEVHRRARRIDGRIGLASVYRTMGLLAQMGLVKDVHVEQRHRRYAQIRNGHGHHLVCTGCGLVQEFSECPADDLARTLARRTHFRIEGHCMEFFGRCAKCRRRSRDSSSGRKRKP